MINDESFISRAEIIWEKGTNRSAFFRGEVDKYGWVDTGSSFLPSDLIAAVLWAQLEQLDMIQNQRIKLWNTYSEELEVINKTKSIKTPLIPKYATNNAHIYYLLLRSEKEREQIITRLKTKRNTCCFSLSSSSQKCFFY